MRDEDPGLSVSRTSCVDVCANGVERGGVQDDRPFAIAFATHVRFTRFSTTEDLSSFKCGGFLTAQARAVQREHEGTCAKSLHVGGVAGAVGWRDRLSSNPGDEVIDTRVHLAPQIVAACQCLTQTKSQLLE